MKWLYLMMICAIFACASPDQGDLRIACAANLSAAVDSIATVYEQENELQIKVVAAASGTLCTQIEQGAPFDVFITASPEYIQRLEKKQLINSTTKLLRSKLYATCTNESNERDLLALLKSDKITSIGIADPEVAPYGRAAKEYLSNVGVWPDVQHKIVYAEDVAQLNTYIETGSIDVGFGPFLYANKRKEAYTHFEIDTTLYSPIVQMAATIKGADNNKCEDFIQFLKGDQASKILMYFGY